VEAVRSLVPELARHPLYVTIDVDVLDPSEAPARAPPNPAALPPRSWRRSSGSSSRATSVGTDLMEVAHAFDPSGRTGITASWILREAILTWLGQVTVEAR
jgi:agmatinase